MTDDQEMAAKALELAYANLEMTQKQGFGMWTDEAVAVMTWLIRHLEGQYGTTRIDFTSFAYAMQKAKERRESGDA